MVDLTTRIQETILQPPPQYRAIPASDSEDDVKEEEEEEEAVVEYEAKWMKQQEILYKWDSLPLVPDERRTMLFLEV